MTWTIVVYLIVGMGYGTPQATIPLKGLTYEQCQEVRETLAEVAQGTWTQGYYVGPCDPLAKR